jgi:hypothetical protein
LIKPFSSTISSFTSHGAYSTGSGLEVCYPSIRVIEKIMLAERQKTIPDSETGVRVTSLKYLIDIRVSTKSLMFETLAFSNGDIFIDMMLPA